MSITFMASAISTSTNLWSISPISNTKSTTCYLSTSSVFCPKSSHFRLPTLVPQLGLYPFSSWTGLRQLGISISPKPVKLERKGKRKGMLVHASLFGVGAPEALVIGVVALLVFGPKGLAEVARNLGKTLREFQPTIRELQDVSREFKSTLEREIGLDDDFSISSQNTYSSKTTKPTATPSSNAATENPGSVVDFNGGATPNSSEDYLNITEEQLTPSSSQEVETPSPPTPSESPVDAQTQTQGDEPTPNRAYSSEEYLKITEEQLKAYASKQKEQTQIQGSAEEAAPKPESEA